jgi:hypothetical protein
MGFKSYPDDEFDAKKLIAVDTDGIIIEDSTNTAQLTIDASGVTIASDLTVQGTTTTIDSATLTVDDKNLELASTASPTDALADGGGIILKGDTDKTILWSDADDAWELNQRVNIETIENSALRLENTWNGGDCAVNFRTSFDADVNWAAGIKNSDDSFRISNSVAVGTDDKLTISTAGNVGIGTDSPTHPLEVHGIENAVIKAVNTQAGGDCAVLYRTSYGTDVNWIAGLKNSDDSFRIAKSQALGTTDHLTIDSTGNVGLGVADPDEQLEITGRLHMGQIAAPSTTTDKLYNVGGALTWNGTDLTAGGTGDVSAGSTFTTANIIMVCDGDDKTIDEPSGTISTNDQALTVGSNTGIRIGDGDELELSVEAGNDVVIRSHGSNNDVHFKVNDGGTNTTVMVLDGGDPAVHIKGGDVSSGILKIFEDSDNGTDAVSITVPADLGAAYTLTLPADDGDSGEFLKTDGSGTLSWDAASGTDRLTITNRFRCGALSATASTYFTGDVATDAGQFYIGSWSKTHGATIDIDADWLSGFEVGPHWQASRACTLTQITATSRINNTAATAVRVHVFKATPVQNSGPTDQLTSTLIGSADLDDGGGSPGVLTDYELQTVNDAISSGNSVSAGDCIFIGLQPITGATAATSYFQITLEFTVS